MITAAPTHARALGAPAVALAVVLAVAAGVAGATTGPMLVVGLLVAGAFVAIAARPALGVLLYLIALPLVAGLERGAVVPLVRPHEALHLFVLAAVASGWLVRYARGETAAIHVSRLDRALLALAFLGSVWPLLSALARGVSLTGEDLAAAAQLWRYVALYALVRCALRTPADVRRCLWAVVLGAVGLSVVALCQSLGVLGVEGLLSRWYLTGDASTFDGRGSATLGNPIAVGDYLAIALALVIVWFDRRPAIRPVLVPVALVLAAGLAGTGQFSAWIAGAIVLLALARHDPRIGRLVRRAAPVGALAVVAAWPVIATRLDELGTRGVPVSWVVRWDNLHTFYLPHLAGAGLVLGVRPDTVVAAPETWRDQIFLESGYVALLWIGGIPLLVGFLVFLGSALRHTHGVAEQRADDVGTAALVAWVALLVLAVLTVLDIHLTLRGGADVLFVLLGVSATRQVAPPARAPDREEVLA